MVDVSKLYRGPVCGNVWNARCELLGMKYERCPQTCTKLAGHVGRCACEFHKLNPHVEWSKKTPVVSGKADFRGVLTLLKEEGLLKYARCIFELKVGSAEQLKSMNPVDLEATGVAWEGALLITGGAKVKRLRVDENGDRDAIDSRRADHPLIKPKTRGNKAKALAEMGTEEGREKWRKEVLKDMYARSSVAPQEACWHTWCEAARVCGRNETPLTHDLVIDCGAFFKSGGYRSVAQYFTRARQEHVNAMRAQVPPDILVLISRVIRSVERGMGASALKDCFRFEDLLKVDISALELPGEDLEDAVSPGFLVLQGTWWFTKGIEASAAKRRDVRIKPGDRPEVSWNLPASKRDPKALGEERTHGCLCD